MKRYAILPQALAEIDEATTSYEEQDAGLGLDRAVNSWPNPVQLPRPGREVEFELTDQLPDRATCSYSAISAG